MTPAETATRLGERVPAGLRVESVGVSVYRFPTPEPESDGTLTWEATTAVVVQAHAGGETGLGWTYSSGAAARLVEEHLTSAVTGCRVHDVRGAYQTMARACRNLGSRGLSMQAVSAVDIALWDLAARLAGQPLAELLGVTREAVPVYGSGGFTSLDDDQLREQVDGWLGSGCSAVKIKVAESWGTRLDRDLRRVRKVRELCGPGIDVMVDANGGYNRGQARRMGAAFDELGVTWFEEPVTSDDLDGLRATRAAVRSDVASGEYVSLPYDAAALCPVVDCLQLDVTRCGGYTGWLANAGVAAAAGLDVSGHCAPALHLPVAAAAANVRHVEWFADHARLEPLLVDGAPAVREGRLTLDRSVPGHGMRLRGSADQWRVA